MGMTDLQFKSYIRKILHMVDDAIKKESKEEMLAAIINLKEELEEDLRG